mmetsp:Transcript_15269/g.61399  ORF Transcript_15269/g.61399 Transcript_15269/m.61399 type:complete len:243 (+) Transcript_15269:96-824(+)
MRVGLIFMHGLGDTSAGWAALEYQLGPALKKTLRHVEHIEWVFPDAPVAPVSINGGAQMTSWFDVFDWPIDARARDDPAGMLASVRTVHDLVAKLEARGVPARNVVVGGFSQGGAVALNAVYRYDKKLAGCVCLSGWLQLQTEWTKAVASASNADTPLFWGHGRYDEIVVPDQQTRGVALAREAGLAVTAESYPTAHASHPQELKDVAAFLGDVWREAATGPAAAAAAAADGASAECPPAAT